MTPIDTNVLVRYLVNDDRKQAERARKLIEGAAAGEDQIYVGTITIVETVWVLETSYGFTRKELCAAVADILAFDVSAVMRERTCLFMATCPEGPAGSSG